jgi:glutaredoxin
MSVVVYGKPDCVQCAYTCKELDTMVDKGQLPGYQYRDVMTDPDAEKEAKAIGLELKSMNLPIVVVRNKHRAERWSGFKIEKLRGLKSTGDY